MESLLNSFGWILSIITAAGNGFVIFLVARSRRLHSSANWFVLSLAVADFIVGIALFPSSYFCNKYSMACNTKVYMAFFWFFLHSSVTNLCTLTLDRYIAIVHPLKYNISMTERRPAMVIVNSMVDSLRNLVVTSRGSIRYNLWYCSEYFTINWSLCIWHSMLRAALLCCRSYPSCCTSTVSQRSWRNCYTTTSSVYPFIHG